MKKTRIIYLLSLFLIILSCTKTVDTEDLPSVPPKPVVISFLSPGISPIFLSLTSTNPINNTEKYAYKNAHVEIIHNSDTAILVYISQENGFLSDSTAFNIEKGETYHLRIQCDNFEDVTAHCQVPTEEVPPYTVTIIANGNSGFYYHVEINNKDEIKAYCMLMFYRPYINFNNDTIYHEIDYQTFQLDHNQAQLVLNDYYSMPDWLPIPGPIPGFEYAIKLLICDEDTYLYHKNLPRNDGPVNPLSPPVFYHFNVNGGLGIFGSYISH